jgi:hypothetical protein
LPRTLLRSLALSFLCCQDCLALSLCLARDFSQSLGLSLSCCFSGFCCQTSRYLGLFLALPFSLFFMASPLFR